MNRNRIVDSKLRCSFEAHLNELTFDDEEHFQAGNGASGAVTPPSGSHWSSTRDVSCGKDMPTSSEDTENSQSNNNKSARQGSWRFAGSQPPSLLLHCCLPQPLAISGKSKFATGAIPAK